MMQKRGIHAKVMAGAFCAFGIGLGLLYFGAPLLIAVPLGLCVLGLLGYDVILKLQKREIRE
jgi:hypothetical protein